MFDLFGFVGGEDVTEESEGHNDPNQQKFFEQEKNDSEKESNTQDGGVELTGTFFIGAGRSGPLKKDSVIWHESILADHQL